MGPKRPIVASIEESKKKDEPAPKRRLLRRTSSEAIDRSIQELFPKMSAKQIDSDKVQGKTFRQHAKALRKAAKQRNGKVSRKQWMDLGAKFGADSMDMSGVEVKDKSLPVDSDLKDACETATHKTVQKRSRSKLISVLASMERLNQRELVGVCRSVSDLNVLANRKIRGEVMQVVQQLCRMGCTESNPEEMASLSRMVDTCLAMEFSGAKQMGKGLTEWYTERKEMVVALGKGTAADIQTAMESSDTVAVEGAISRAKSCQLGERMFSTIGAMLTFTKASEQMVELVEKSRAKNWMTGDAEALQASGVIDCVSVAECTEVSKCVESAGSENCFV
eukprot:1874556-Amphidinium_carterae.2